MLDTRQDEHRHNPLQLSAVKAFIIFCPIESQSGVAKFLYHTLTEQAIFRNLHQWINFFIN
jgi:hypothetical protein